MLIDTFPKGSAKKLRDWRLLSIGAAIVTLFLLIVFETLNNVQYMASAKKDLTSDGILDPLPLSMLVWQYFAFWTVCSALPFYLSQQVAICLLLVGKMLADCCMTLASALKVEYYWNWKFHSSDTVILCNTRVTLKLFTPPFPNEPERLFINLSFNHFLVFTVKVESFFRPFEPRPEEGEKLHFWKEPHRRPYTIINFPSSQNCHSRRVFSQFWEQGGISGG